MEIAEPESRAATGTMPAPILRPALVMGAALFFSGAAGVLNQVVWQRSLKRFLGGSESLSSMAIVLVFMAGLGVGSLLMGRYTARVKNALRGLGVVEALLAGVNLLVCAALNTEVATSLFALQKAAALSGVPLPALYVCTAVAILTVPCLLMGATMPLASEACQRHFNFSNSRVLGVLFFINTFGSVAGAIVGSTALIPRLGLTQSLLIACGLNLLAGAMVLLIGGHGSAAVCQPVPPAADATTGTGLQTAAEPSHTISRSLRPSAWEVLSLGLGFCSLGYEMLLFRFFAIVNRPLSFVFAAVLTGFLLFWSFGAYAGAARKQSPLGRNLLYCAAATLLAGIVFLLDTEMSAETVGQFLIFVVVRTPYFLPCFCFGYLFTQVTASSVKNWGQDVGRLYAWNTCGSCLGVLAMTLAGLEINPILALAILAVLLSALFFYSRETGLLGAPPSRRAASLAAVALAAVLLIVGLRTEWPIPFSKHRWFFAKNGTVAVARTGQMFWDGLWHSSLTNKDNLHFGSNNWRLAISPVLLHSTGQIKDVCVIGAGTGITAGTLAKLNTVARVDTYEFNYGLKRLYEAYPLGTMYLLTNPKIQMLWQDARTGLALREHQYDVIQTQPLYIKQSGSGLLNSVEFYRQVSARLKPNGVFCLYSNGTPEQALVVRNTARQVFKHGESLFDGYLLIMSNDPLDVRRETIARRIAQDDPLWNEIRNYEPFDTLMKHIDQPRLPWDAGPLTVTDDFPIIEYPEICAELVRRGGYRVER